MTRGDWTYAKDGGTLYPVEPGDTWVVGTVARLTVGDLQELPVMPPARLAYIDPPWGTGPRNSYQTKAGRPHAETPWHVFLSHVMRVTSAAEVRCVEMGNRDTPSVIAAMGGTRAGSPTGTVTRYAITRDGGYPCALLCSQPHTTEDPTGLDDAVGDVTPRWAIREYTRPGDTVLDCCTGRGLTAVETVTAGRSFHGYELSQWRASVTLRKLGELTGYTPRKVTP